MSRKRHLIDLGPDEKARFVVAENVPSTASVLDVLDGRLGRVVYRGDNYDRAEAVRDACENGDT